MPRQQCEIWNSPEEKEERWLVINGSRAEDPLRGEAYAITRGPATVRRGKRMRQVYVFNRATVATTSPGERVPPAPPEPAPLVRFLERAGLKKRSQPATTAKSGAELVQVGESAPIEDQVGTINLQNEVGEFILNRLTPGLFFAMSAEAALKAAIGRHKTPISVYVLSALAGAGVMYFVQNIIKAWRFGT